MRRLNRLMSREALDMACLMFRHHEERSDEAIQGAKGRDLRPLDCFASLAMTTVGAGSALE